MDGFAAWQIFNAPSERTRRIIDAFRKDSPKDICFSIVIPVGSQTRAGTEEIVGSIAAQSHPDFELIFVEEARGDLDLYQTLREWAKRDGRIRLLDSHCDGRVAAINCAVDAAKGAFIVLADRNGLLHENALLLFADYIRRNSEADVIYADDAAIDSQTGSLTDPRFKPDWSPELLLSYDYASPLLAIRTSVYKAVGGLRPDFEGTHGHDLLLRAGEQARHVGHVPQLLFYRRGDEAPRADPQTGRRAVAEAFVRRGLNCRVDRPQWARERGLDVYVPEMAQDGPSVALIIPTKNNWETLDRLLKSLRSTRYENYRVTIVDNMSDDEATIAYLKSVEHDVIRIADPGSAFSYAHINNRAVEQADADFVLLLNDDTSVTDPNWLGQMMGWARLPGVGAVGARLLFPDGRVQHGGVVLGLRKGLTAFRGLPGDDPGYLNFAKATRNSSAVTAAAMLTPRSLFLELGGFDESAFAVSYNDVDYCLRLADAGYRVVYCGETELYHHQGYTRGSGSTSPLERAALAKRYGNRADPHYSPHLSLDGQEFAIKPTVVPPLPFGRPIKVLYCSNGRAETAKTVFDLISGIEHDGAIALTVLERSPALRTQSDYERWLVETAAAAGLESFDVIMAEGAESFWAIDAARRAGVPSLWAIRDDESPQVFVALPCEVAAAARACFNHPYRVVFASGAARKRWVDFDKLGNFDLASWGPAPSPNAQVYRRFVEGAAFSAVPDI